MGSKLAKLTATCVVAGAFFCHGPVRAQSAEGHSDWPGPGQLFVGTNYQSVDRSDEQIRRDIARMKQAGFKVVRVGDLSWDHFEPAEGKFDFKTFDWMMDELHAAGLKVILDIPASRRRSGCTTSTRASTSSPRTGCGSMRPSAIWTTSAIRITGACSRAWPTR